jgi:hypothetical protein
MRKLFFAVLLCLAVGALAVPAAFADSPHFIGTPKVSKSLSTGLTVSGKAAGLGNGPVTAFLTASSVTATFECVNHGKNVAPGQPVVLTNVTGPTQTITPRNGQITFTVTLPPPPTPSPSVDCPNPNWTVQIASLTYNDVVLHVGPLVANLGTIDP